VVDLYNENVIYIRPPEVNEEGEYLLLIYNRATPFQTSLTSIVVDNFAIYKDNNGLPIYYEAFTKGSKVAMFPATQEYLLVRRGLVDIIPGGEFREAQKAARKLQKEDLKLLREEDDLGGPSEEQAHPGLYA